MRKSRHLWMECLVCLSRLIGLKNQDGFWQIKPGVLLDSVKEIANVCSISGGRTDLLASELFPVFNEPRFFVCFADKKSMGKTPLNPIVPRFNHAFVDGAFVPNDDEHIWTPERGNGCMNVFVGTRSYGLESTDQ